MGSKSSKQVAVGNNTKMGSTSSKQEEKEETNRFHTLLGKGGPKPEEVLIEKLVDTLPDLIMSVNRDKDEFLSYYHSTWKEDRDSLRRGLESMSEKVGMILNCYQFWDQIRTACIVSKVLLLLSVVFFPPGMVNVFVVLSLTIDFLFYGLHIKCKTVTDDVKRIFPGFHRDISNTDKLKELWIQARHSCDSLQDEIKRFILTVRGPGFGNDLDPAVKRFINVTGSKDPSKENDMTAFLDAFLQLIINFNSPFVSKRIKERAYEEYMDRCALVTSQVDDLKKDVSLLYKDMQFSRLSTVLLEIVTTDDPQALARKLSHVEKILGDENTAFTKDVRNIGYMKKMC